MQPCVVQAFQSKNFSSIRIPSVCTAKRSFQAREGFTVDIFQTQYSWFTIYVFTCSQHAPQIRNYLHIRSYPGCAFTTSCVSVMKISRLSSRTRLSASKMSVGAKFSSSKMTQCPSRMAVTRGPSWNTSRPVTETPCQHFESRNWQEKKKFLKIETNLFLAADLQQLLC